MTERRYIMARHPKKGIDYSSWDVDVLLGDTDIDKLMESQGCAGFTVYFYLCQMAYKFEGYFLKWSYDDAATTAKRVGGGVGSEAVIQTVNLCLRLGLFHKGLFDKYSILTSRRIQDTFAEATARRRGNVVISDYWLLEKNSEASGSNKSIHFQDLCCNNPDSCNNNPAFCGNNPTKVEESKAEESKGKQSEADAAFAATASAGQADNACDYFRNFINPTAPQRDFEEMAEFIRFFDERGNEGNAVVVFACQIAQSKRAFVWAFIRKVLDGWKKAGVYTLAQCKAYERDWKAKKGSDSTISGGEAYGRVGRDSQTHAGEVPGKGGKWGIKATSLD